MTNINDLLAKLQTQTAQLRAAIPTAKEATVHNTVTVETPEHDWASYDSSDIHQRTAEWETQARQPVVIQHFVPKKRKLRITEAQRVQANAALDPIMPGVRLSEHLTQRKAHALLVEFVGVDVANTIMTGGE